MRPSSTSSSWPRSWLCHAVRAPGSKRRRATERSLPSIASVLPVKRGVLPGACCASPTQRVQTTSNNTSEQSNATRFMWSPIFSESPIRKSPIHQLPVSLHWRVIRGVGVHRLDFDAADPGVGRDFLPLGIRAEFGPVLLRLVATRVRNQVDERAVLQRRVLRRQVNHVLDAVLLEDTQRVIAKAFVQVLQLAFSRGVRAQLVHTLALGARDAPRLKRVAREKPGDE